MGVKGLKTYIKENGLLKDWNLQNSVLIIDGSNLCFLLYEHLQDIQHGGDYYGYEREIQAFFETLRECKIEPHVVLDGGYDHTDTKLQTQKERIQSRITLAKRISLREKTKNTSLKPPLLKMVFIELLTLLNVPFTQCMEEADGYIAALANKERCPVLSDDSDFFIFEVQAGVFPIEYFKWKNMNKGSTKAIPAKRYLLSDFCISKNVHKSLVPLVAALAGNDYVNLENKVSLRWEEFTMVTGYHARLDGICCWLSEFQNTKKATGAVLNNTVTEHRVTVRQCLKACQEHYQLRKFNTTLPVELQSLPEWIKNVLSKGKLSIIIETWVSKRRKLGPQVENFDFPSSNAISRSIRQVLYGLLWPRQACHVDEYDREGDNLSQFRVEAADFREKDLQLETLNVAKIELRQQVLYETLGVTKPISTSLADNLHLPVYVTCYWMTNAKPQPCIEHMWALLLGFVFGELFYQYKDQEGITMVWKRLKKLRHKSKLTGFSLQAAHTYSQWQACMRDSYNLNQLLCLPVPEPKLARLYCGPLVHQAALRLMEGDTPNTFLRGGPIPQQIFEDLQHAVLVSLDPKVLNSVLNSSQLRRRTQSLQNFIVFTAQDDNESKVESDDEIYSHTKQNKGRAKRAYHLLGLRYRYLK